MFLHLQQMLRRKRVLHVKGLRCKVTFSVNMNDGTSGDSGSEQSSNQESEGDEDYESGGDEDHESEGTEAEKAAENNGLIRGNYNGYTGLKIEHHDMEYESDGNGNFRCLFQAPGDTQVCGNIQKRRNDLKKHYAKHFVGKLPHRCNSCGKELKSKQGIEDHVRIHRANHGYKCPICDAKYKTRQQRSRCKKKHLA